MGDRLRVHSAHRGLARSRRSGRSPHGKVMDSPLVVAFIGAIGSVIAVVIANRFTTRATRKAQRQAAEIEGSKVDAQAYARARESYDAALATQKQRLVELQ